MRQWINLIVEGSMPNIQAEAARLDVDLEVFEDEDRIELHWIQRSHKAPKGVGAQIMEKLCDYADDQDKPIILQLAGDDDEYGPGGEHLAAYYEDFGFEDIDPNEYQDHWADWDIDEVMIRYPHELVEESESSEDEPYIDDHRAGDTMIIDMIRIPPSQRGKGMGTALYQKWEEELPADIELVRIWAADTGAGKSDKFWDRMGFSYQYDGENLDYDTAQWMWKGVNGHPTPETVWVDSEEDEEPYDRDENFFSPFIDEPPENLKEAFGTTDKLYHGTNIDNFWLIMREGKLSTNWHGRDYAGPAGVCLSRSFGVAKSHANAWADNLSYSFFEYFDLGDMPKNFGEVVFEFDRSKIEGEIVPYDDLGDDAEEEERVIGDLSLSALTAIYVSPKDIHEFLSYATKAHKANADATEYNGEFEQIIKKVLADPRLRAMPAAALNESLTMTLDVYDNFGHPKKIRVLTNPSAEQLTNIMNSPTWRDDYKGILYRGIIDGDQAVIWRASEALHMGVANALGIPGGDSAPENRRQKIFINYKDGQPLLCCHISYVDHPWIRKMVDQGMTLDPFNA